MRALKTSSLILVIIMLSVSSCSRHGNNSQHSQTGSVEVYLNPDVDIETRVEDLLKRLTLEEKIRLLHGNVTDNSADRFYAAGVERLNIPPIAMLDGRQGVRTFDGTLTTALPSTLSLSCTWDENAARTFGGLLAEEILAVNRNLLLAPMINLVRTPLNGRNFENLGEDPYMAGRMAVAYIQGVQDKYVGACACLLVANDYESGRHYTSSNMDDRTLREVHMLPYEMAARDGKVWSMMSANSLLNGIHCAHNKTLLQEIMKDEIGYDGVILTDWRAAYDAVPAALAGTDMTTGFCAYVFGDGKLLEAVREGQVPESLIDDKARRVIRLCIRCGVLNPELQEKGSLDTEEHRAIARRLGAEGMVLLKNEKGILPLDPDKMKRILLAGPGLEVVAKGGGSGDVHTRVNITPLEGLRSALEGKVELIPVPFNTNEESNEADFPVLEVSARSADAVIFFALSGAYSEGRSLKTMDLPYNQAKAIDILVRVNRNIIVVLMSGSAASVEPWADKVPVILGAWYAGQATGDAIADILTGKVNPGGKLSFTMARKLDDYPVHAFGEWPARLIIDEPPQGVTRDPAKRKVIHAYTGEYKEGVFVGHRWFDENKIKPRYEFGYGLSYTTFEFSDMILDVDKKSIKIECKVKNTGPRSGSEVVQVYISPPESSVPRPPCELKGFLKVFLEEGEEQKVEISIPKSLLSYYHVEGGNWKLEAGEYGILVGNSSRNILLENKVKFSKDREFERF